MTIVEKTHPRHQLNELLLNPIRFSLVASLDKAEKLSFSEVRDIIEVSDSVMSKQVSALEQVNILLVQKIFVGKYPKTMLSLTKEGRSAWQEHLAALKTIAG